LERGPHGSNGNSMSRRILDWNTEKLGTDGKSNRGSIEKYKEAIQ